MRRILRYTLQTVPSHEASQILLELIAVFDARGSIESIYYDPKELKKTVRRMLDRTKVIEQVPVIMEYSRPYDHEDKTF